MHYNCGKGLLPISWARADLGLDGYLCCPGPSLANAPDELRGVGRKVFAINTAYPRVRPDMWIGMDKAECYDRQLWNEPFPKICRGGLQNTRIGGNLVCDFPEVYWASLKKPEPGTTMFDFRNHQDVFVWEKNTLGVALHIMVWMGVREFRFIGCDMGGSRDYYDDRVLSEEQRTYNRRLYDFQIGWLRDWTNQARERGMNPVSCTPDSPLNEFMEHIAIDDAIADTERRHGPVDDGPIVHCLETVTPRTVALLTPTRGDRMMFVEQCEQMMSRQTVKGLRHYVIDGAPHTEENDQRERIRAGVEDAKADGATHVLVIEDDDYYPPEYVETVLQQWDQHPEAEIIGSLFYQIYHLRERSHTTLTVGLSGVKVPPLHSTGFSIDAYERFIDDGTGNLDDALWRWAYEHASYKFLYAPLVVSMKHGLGKTGGGLHTHSLGKRAIPDSELRWLARQVDSDRLLFYEYVSRTLIGADDGI